MGEMSTGKLCFSVIPVRYIFVFLTSAALFLVYAFKGFLGVAIVSMVRHSDNSNITDESECPSDISDDSDHMNGEFDWDDRQQAIALGSFFYGYVCTQIPFGIAVEKFSTKWMFGFSILISSLLSLIGPIAAKWGFAPFLVTRLGQGLAQGVILPGMNAMIARWMPKMERSRAVSIIFAGSAFGSVVTLPLTGYLCHETSLGGWPTIFYVLGAAGCVWFVFWSFFVFDTPESHPYISDSELKIISEGQGDEKISAKRTIPWKSIVTSHRVYPLIVTHFGYNWGYLTILTLMPTYFKQILHMNVKTNGLISSLPYIALAVVSCLASFTTDKLRERGFSITLLRKVNNSIGIYLNVCPSTKLNKIYLPFSLTPSPLMVAFFGTGLCLIGVVLSKCDKTLSILFFVIGMGLNGFCYPGFLSNYVDMAPDFAGVLMGFGNSFGNTPGFIAPSVATLFYSSGQNLKNWGKVFYTCFAVYFFTQIVYILFTTSELQTWGLTKKHEKENSHNSEKLEKQP